MLLWPGSTGRYFSWRLSPAPVASFVGACYVASAIVFGWAAAVRSWSAQRGLCASVLGLAAPTLVVTAAHREVFDFGRWQAVAWIVLFAASVTSFATLVAVRGPRAAVPRRRAGAARRGASRAGGARRALRDRRRGAVGGTRRGLRPRPDHGRADGPALPRLVGGLPRPVRPLRRRPRLPGRRPPARRRPRRVPDRRRWWPPPATSTTSAPARAAGLLAALVAPRRRGVVSAAGGS